MICKKIESYLLKLKQGVVNCTAGESESLAVSRNSTTMNLNEPSKKIKYSVILSEMNCTAGESESLAVSRNKSPYNRTP